jgi:hypothetical protein
MSVEQAAAFLGVAAVTLRRNLERNARALPDGGTASQADGIKARKLGRCWRVWLDSGWVSPSSVRP